MKKILITTLLLLGALPLMAQQLPERSEVRRGNRQFNKGNYEQSSERYRNALMADSLNFEARYNLGNAEYKMERYEASEQTLLRAAADSLRNNEERAMAFYNLGNAQFKQQKLKEALQSYKNSLLLNPADMEAKYNYAYTKKLLEDQQQDGGGGDNNQDQNQDQNQNQDQQQQQQGQNDQQQNKDQNQDQQQNPDNGDQKPQDEKPQGQQPQPQQGISEQEQQQILDAIQAQEDRTQEKLKEKQGIIIRGTKNW